MGKDTKAGVGVRGKRFRVGVEGYEADEIDNGKAYELWISSIIAE